MNRHRPGGWDAMLHLIRGKSPSSDHPQSHQTVEEGIQGNHEEAQNQLMPSGEIPRVKQGNQEVLHETTAVATLSPQNPEADFQRGQRANPAHELHQCAPDRDRDVHPGPPPSTEHQQPAQHDETDEGQVQEHKDVGQNAIDHETSW
jgi:hypothetical protein